MIGALFGIVTSFFPGLCHFRRLDEDKHKKLFNITGFVLILFAVGLFDHGVHEFEEVGIIPIIIEHVWNIDPPLNHDGSYPVFHEDGSVGGILKS